jgi:site-specific recombinase XerC
LVDGYLELVAARCRPNTVLAAAYDLKVFFEVVGKELVRVSTADVFAFIAAQRAPRRGSGVVRLEDGEAGLSARTIKRRLASVSGLFGYLIARDDVALRRNPVPRGVATRSPHGGLRGVPRPGFFAAFMATSVRIRRPIRHRYRAVAGQPGGLVEGGDPFRHLDPERRHVRLVDLERRPSRVTAW